MICVPAFVFEFYRARHGNLLSWAYVIEWPILAVYAVYMWRKLLREERGEDARSISLVDRDERLRLAEEQDPELKAWNEYLASVHKTAQTPDDEN